MQVTKYIFLPLHQIQCTSSQLWILDVEYKVTGEQHGEASSETHDVVVDDTFIDGEIKSLRQ
jgi:hypothetical protein